MAAPNSSADHSQELLDHVQQAIAARQPLFLQGGQSKAFLGRAVDAPALDITPHSGVVHYDPTELVITARAGTPLVELLSTLDAAGQTLPCDPPRFTDAATVGGMVASGLSGPRRPWSGAIRDFILGTRLISGHGTHLRFGGEVMKNVAGYDLSRTLAGSLGCLGLITEVSLKVLPKPRHTQSLGLEIDEAAALALLGQWNRQGIPLSGACHAFGQLHVRLEGGHGSVDAAAAQIGGHAIAPSFWVELRDHKLAFFQDTRPLWRLALPDNTPALALPGDALTDWGGAQRWLKSDADASDIRRIAAQHGGHATCYGPAPGREPFHPLSPALLRYHQQLKQQLDPQGIFNPGRMYVEF